jgi:hypothetical protein
VTNAQRLALAGASLVLIAAVVAFLTTDRASHLDKAINRLGDAKRFTTSAKAGQTVADISTTLRIDGAKCRDQRKARGPECAALLSAAAFTAVTAVSMLDCTAPDVYDARLALGKYLRTLRDFVEGDRAKPPTLPKVITC